MIPFGRLTAPGNDRNRDERLTWEEPSRGRPRERVVNRVFDLIDENHDGVLTLEEARTFAIIRATNQNPASHPCARGVNTVKILRHGSAGRVDKRCAQSLSGSARSCLGPST